MSYSLEIRFAPANELFISLYSYLCKKIQKRLELGSDWVTETKAKLPASYAKKLGQVDIQDLWHPINILMTQAPANQTVEDFLHWFEQVSAGEIYELLVPYLSTFTENLGEIKGPMLELLVEWNEHYFSRLDPQIVANLQAHQQHWSHFAYEDAAELTGEVTNGCRFEEKEGLQKVLLIPHYHYSPFNHIKNFGVSTLCMYAVDALPPAEGEPSLQVSRFTRCTADRNRIKIMRFLNEKPRTLNELAALTGLAKSTVHDHVTTLRTGGLVMNHVVGEAAAFYSFRSAAFHQLSEQLRQYIEM